MLKENAGAGEVDHAEEVFREVLPSNYQLTRVPEPGKQPFDFPVAATAAQGLATLSATFAAAIVECRACPMKPGARNRSASHCDR